MDRIASSLELDFAKDGATLHRAAIRDVGGVLSGLAGLPEWVPGIRLHGNAAIRALIGADGPIGALAAQALGRHCRPVRAVLFDKSPAANWALDWHQDRTIVVKHRIDVDGFGPWSVKSGMQHVEPPIVFLEAMATVRIHLDPVANENAPLRIARGSHRRGRIPVARISEVVAALGGYSCLADAGDVWVYSTPILHASARAVRPARRRVLQVDYSADELPGGLEWLGI